MRTVAQLGSSERQGSCDLSGGNLQLISQRITPALSASIRSAVLPFLVTRLLVLIVLIFAASIRFDAIPAREGLNWNATIEIHRSSAIEGVKRVLGSADAAWYLEIAQTGYHQEPFQNERPRNWVFFPLYPLTVRLLASGSFTPIAESAAPAAAPTFFAVALILANLSFFGALALLHRLARVEGFSETESARCVWLLAAAPTSSFFSAPMTESFFLLLILAAWLACRRGRLKASGTFFALAVLTRPTGMLLAPAFVWEILGHRPARTANTVIALFLPALAILGFLYALSQLSGEPLAFALHQQAWGRAGRGMFALITETARNIHIPLLPWNFVWLNAGAIVLSLVGSIVMFRERHISYALMLAVPPLALLCTGTVLSGARLTMVLFPLVFWLAHALSRPALERAAFLIAGALLMVMTAMYGLLVTAGMA